MPETRPATADQQLVPGDGADQASADRDEIASVIRRHPAVADVAVIERTAAKGGQELVALVVPASSASVDTGASQQAQVDDWGRLFEQMYGRGGTDVPATAPLGDDFGGWNSAYDGRPLPREQMAQWRDATVERIASSRQKRILEIGVGKGLLLAPLIGDVETYWATDISPAAVSTLRHQLDAWPELAGRVELRAQPAHVFDGLPTGFFDVVVLNSVAQYFPDADYLSTVLRSALTLLAPDGAVFVGDVRNLRLQRTFETAVQATRAKPGQERADVLAAVDQRARQETELLVDPEFFDGLVGRDGFYRVTGVDVRIKRGRYSNELNRYRYDVTLHTARPRDAAGIPRRDWAQDVRDLNALQSLLIEAWPDGARVTGVPNGRMAHEAEAARLLAVGEPLAQARRELERLDEEIGVDPEALYELGAAFGYRTAVTWSGDAEDGSLDVVFLPQTEDLVPSAAEGEEALSGVYLSSAGAASTAGTAAAAARPLTNDPGGVRRAGQLTRALRTHLRENLPSRLGPVAVVVVEELPDRP
ncbi:class I SAM-dependent methyltransferase [Actinospica robiniae]|uniref:class I SAM-dependent methyltransferase n=1 Tax=Actinospica robiniae TaxID=304901 RepID=UPI000415304B|nr:class I SAM-dependent methyltransferase [Actinospica robiniae]